MSVENSRKQIDNMVELVKTAQTVGLEAYGGNSIEYMKANKETIGLMIAMDDIKSINLLILEELKKLNEKFPTKEEQIELKEQSLEDNKKDVIENTAITKGKLAVKKD